MMKNIILILTIALLLTSCFKKDELLPAPIPGDELTATIPMTNFYSNQVYFHLNTGEITGTNYRSDFDLIFECIDTSTVVRLNTADFAMAALTEFSDFESVTDTTGLEWLFDGSSGSLDSLAFSNWITIDGSDTNYLNKIYVINRGINDMGIQLGLMKIRFDSIIGNAYYFTYADFGNSETVKAEVIKDPTVLYTQYSFTLNEQIQTEPPLEDWDLLFTQYTTMLYTNEGDAYPYLVTGVLQQYGKVEVALDTTNDFKRISIADTSNLDFSYQYDKIGYDWKELIGDVGSGDIRYEVKPNLSYIIKSSNSYYFKLRFVNFYNPETGEKGYPTFEYQRL